MSRRDVNLRSVHWLLSTASSLGPSSATTALVLDPAGYARGLQYGANVVMPISHDKPQTIKSIQGAAPKRGRGELAKARKPGAAGRLYRQATDIA